MGKGRGNVAELAGLFPPFEQKGGLIGDGVINRAQLCERVTRPSVLAVAIRLQLPAGSLLFTVNLSRALTRNELQHLGQQIAVRAYGLAAVDGFFSRPVAEVAARFL